VNRIRHEHGALQFNDGLHFHATDNEQLIAYSKRRVGPQANDVILTIVNLDHHYPQSGWVSVDLDRLGLSAHHPYVAHDLLSDAHFTWTGSSNFVSLDPRDVPCHVFSLTQNPRSGLVHSS
jgi:starch synthase (maltosyl-transferring)